MLEKTLKSPLDCKIKLVNPKQNQSWVSIGRTHEAPILWPPDVKSWLIRKDADPGDDWRQEKGMTEDEMVGWHHQLNGHESEQAPGVGNRQGSLVCCSPYGCSQTQLSDWTELMCWRRLLRISWTARRSNQSILKETNPGYSLEGLMLKLKLQYFSHLMPRANSLEKTLILGKIKAGV